MKKLLCLLLVAILIPSVFVFSACGNDNAYKLSSLSADYSKIDDYENVKMEKNKIVFDYDKFVYENEHILTYCIDNVEPYTELKNYNTLLNNILIFVYEYIDVCSNDNIEADAKIRNEVKFNLDEMNSAIKDVDTYINQWYDVIRFKYNDNILDSACLSRFETLLESYSDLYQKAINFSNTISRIYYKYALNDSNPNIYEKGYAQFDASVVVSKLPGRIRYQISNLSQSFVEMYVDGEDLAKFITDETSSGFGKMDLTQYNYLNSVNSISKDIDLNKAVEIANNIANKEKFYNLAIDAYNIVNIIDNDYEMFIKACNNVIYTEVNSSSSSLDQVYAKLIENNKFIINRYNLVLTEMVDIITGV